MATLQHIPAELVSAPALPVPAGRRLPFGWPAVALTAAAQAEPLALRWTQAVILEGPIRLRISLALDANEAKKVEVRLAKSQKPLGVFDVRFASALQPFEIELTEAGARAAFLEGIVLRQTLGESPLWIFAVRSGQGTLSPTHAPHFLMAGDQPDPLAEFYKRLASHAVTQPFGWMEGCVLDGLQDLSQLPGRALLGLSLRRQLGLFFHPDKSLVYESPGGVIADEKLHDVEATLPFAALAWVEPQHPALELARKFWQSRTDAGGLVREATLTTSEGSYTVGYPLAVLARQRQSDELARLALTQVRVRQNRLFEGKDFFCRLSADGQRAGRNWSRGIAWQLLGLVRVLAVLRERADLEPLKQEALRLAEWVTARQLPSGLWPAFVDEPALPPDTSGSAGLAAALALGAKQGLLPGFAREAAAKTLTGLLGFLTPDGFLTGCAPAGNGGESLQRGSYRVISPMAMGLLAQLIAALPATHRASLPGEFTADGPA